MRTFGMRPPVASPNDVPNGPEPAMNAYVGFGKAFNVPSVDANAPTGVATVPIV